MASYTDEFADRLEVIWGAGFLSPGGPDEVREILRDLDTRDREVLDIGCGIAGPAMVIARDCQVRSIVGVDLEPQVIARGNRNIAAAGLQDRIQLLLVKPGPLPFEDASFDIVFSKDAIVHVEDKLALYTEIRRVLKPGGCFAIGDWLASADADQLPGFARYRQLSHLEFVMHTADEMRALLLQADFENVTLRDRNHWYATNAQQRAAQIEGPLKAPLLEVCSEETYRQMVEVSRANAAAAECGGLRPTHLRGWKALS